MLISGLMAITHLVRLCDGIHTKNAFSGYQNEKIVKKIPLKGIYLIEKWAFVVPLVFIGIARICLSRRTGFFMIESLDLSR